MAADASRQAKAVIDRDTANWERNAAARKAKNTTTTPRPVKKKKASNARLKRAPKPLSQAEASHTSGLDFLAEAARQQLAIPPRPALPEPQRRTAPNMVEIDENEASNQEVRPVRTEPTRPI